VRPTTRLGSPPPTLRASSPSNTASLVETAARNPRPDDRADWEAVDAPGFTDRFLEYLSATPATGADRAIHDVAEALRQEATPGTALEVLNGWLHDHLEYQSGVTSVSTTAAEAFAAGRGVCQDFVHLGLAVLRAAGVPARYVSGYLHPGRGDTVGVTSRGDTHAWLEAWVGDWHPIDPTSGAVVAEHHVVIARGRDYSDVAPLKGVYHGGSSHELEVSVELTRVA
jgi:transglutaminase-like putative cysteine protease